MLDHDLFEGWDGRHGGSRDGAVRQAPRGELIRKPYGDPLDAVEDIESYESLAQMSETEIYHFVCGSSPEDVTDAILELMCGR